MLLFKLKSPLTNVRVTRQKGLNSLAVDIADHFAGRLVVPLDETGLLALNVFADTRNAIGHIEDGEVVWYLDTVAHNILTVVDALGNIHPVEEL